MTAKRGQRPRTKAALRCVVLLDNRQEPRPRDTVTVTVYGAGYLGFRPSRATVEYCIPLDVVYQQAVKMTVRMAAPRKERDV